MVKKNLNKTIYYSGSVLLFLFYCSLLLCTSSPSRATEKPKPFSSILPRDALEMIQQNRGNPDFVLIDIRTPEEFMSGYIESAININYHDSDFVEQLDKLDKGKTYLIYCRTGRRSGDAINVMKRLQFQEVYRILGDIVRWKAEGLPVVKK
jgi:rhodanese-related sulfurtransferase